MIISLNKDNKNDIEELINNNNNVIILYYSLTCYYCNILKPTWNKLCENLKNKKGVIIINIESENIKHIKEKYKKDVEGYPTIVKYSKGKKIKEYNGKRELEDLKNFIK